MLGISFTCRRPPYLVACHSIIVQFIAFCFVLLSLCFTSPHHTPSHLTFYNMLPCPQPTMSSHQVLECHQHLNSPVFPLLFFYPPNIPSHPLSFITFPFNLLLFPFSASPCFTHAYSSSIDTCKVRWITPRVLEGLTGLHLLSSWLCRVSLQEAEHSVCPLTQADHRGNHPWQNKFSSVKYILGWHRE